MGPSERRNVHGRADHGLVECEFTWRIRSPKKKPKVDFDALFAENLGMEEIGGRKTPLQTFNDAVQEKMEEVKVRHAEQNGTVSISSVIC